VWTAEVEGSEVYSFEIILEGKDEVATLFCDYAHEVDVCKHVAAGLYAIKEQLKAVKINPLKKAKRLSFTELVEKHPRCWTN
jgi:uncharacterized Zn finger protein